MKIICFGILFVLINSFVFLGKLFKFYVFQFSYLYNGNNNRFYFKGFCEELYESFQNIVWYVGNVRLMLVI